MKNTVQNFDDQFKIIIVGTSGVGKSAILVRFADDKFDDDLLRPTIGVDFRFKTMDVDGKKIKVQIWDTAGQEGFRTIVSAYYKGADAIIVVFDNSDNHSFTDIEQFWSSQIIQNKEDDCIVMILANKCDLPPKPPNEIRITAIKQKLGANLYFPVSAKENQKIDLAFNQLCRQLIKRKVVRAKKTGTKLSSSQIQQDAVQKKGCCK